MTATTRPRAHDYETELRWTGSRGVGTASYTSYDRDYRISVAGKPDLEGSSDAMFRGTAERYNPEDLLVAALSACHMLAYLALCARAGVRVVDYTDRASGTLVFDAQGGGRFESVTLRPMVTIADPAHADSALALHHTAHDRCFIASSCSVPVRHEPVLRVAGA